MYLVGDTILCIQDHPEYDARYIAGLVEMRRPRMGDEIAERIVFEPRRAGWTLITASASGLITALPIRIMDCCW